MPASSRQWGAGSGSGGSREPAEGALSPYLRAVRTHWRVVLLVALAITALAALWSQTRASEYRAGAEILVTPLPFDDEAFLGLPYIRDTGDPPRTLQTAATLIDSQRAAAATARALGPSWSQREVERAIEVNPQGQSSVIEVTAVAHDPAESARVANRYVRSVLDVRRATLRPLVQASIENTRDQLSRLPQGASSAETLADRLARLESVADGDDPTLSVSQVAAPPSEPLGSSTSLMLGIGLLLGLVLGSIVALLLEVLRPRRLSDEEEAFGIYPIPVLARIPELPRRWRRGGSPLATPPLVREGFRSLQVQLELEPGQHRAILLTSASSGDGKTTSAINFALELVSSGQRVVLMDLDLRRPDVGPALGLSPQVELHELLDGHATLDDALVDLPGVSGLRVLPIAPQRGFQALEKLARVLPALIQEALEDADYVILDSAPAGEVSDPLRLVGAVDDVLVVAQFGRTRLANLETMRDLLARVERPPLGWIMIGDSRRLTASSYSYAQVE